VNNLLISNDDILKLSDFGVSVSIGDDDDLIPSNSGPATYTPPEKNLNQTHYHGKQADMWLCGVTLYHMIYRKPYFKHFNNLSMEDYE
jgi:serine/threonine protein kinase